MRRFTIPLAFLTLTCFVVAGCASTPKTPRKSSRVVSRAPQGEESSVSAKLLPWEVWQPFQDLNGQRLSNKNLLLGDEYASKGKRRSALDAYLEAARGPLLPREMEAATLRVSSQYLALDQSNKALSAISTYFKDKGLDERQVGSSFALVLAFAYGRTGDVNQSLAWFSRVNGQSKAKGFEGEVARRGTVLLLRSLSAETFESVADGWYSDEFINQVIGRERLRRASRAPVTETVAVSTPFWSAYDDVMVSAEPIAPGLAPGAAGVPVIGVLLSLSDKFSVLGRETKQGIELAVEAAQSEDPKPKLEVRDVGSDGAAVSAAVRELSSGARSSVVLGPLLTEAAITAADTARELQTPLISFSKSESFRTGDTVFRLGATSTSQIDALMQAAHNEQGMTRFAVVYPQSATGSEYVQVFKRKLAALGLSLVLEVNYSSTDDVSMARAAEELEQSTAEAFLIPDSIDSSARLLSNLTPTTRRKIRPMGTALWDNPVKIANSQALFEHSFFVTPFFPHSTRPVVKQFVDSYRGRYNSSPNFLAAQGFDAGTLAVAALRKSSKEGISVVQALSSLAPYDGVTGYITCQQPEGLHRAFYVVEVTADAFMESMPGTVKSSELTTSADTFTFRGNQLVDPTTGEPALRREESVDSGY